MPSLTVFPLLTVEIPQREGEEQLKRMLVDLMPEGVYFCITG